MRPPSPAAGASYAVEEARPGNPPTYTQEVQWPPSLLALSDGPSILTLLLTFTISTSLTLAKLRVAQNHQQSQQNSLRDVQHGCGHLPSKF